MLIKQKEKEEIAKKKRKELQESRKKKLEEIITKNKLRAEKEKNIAKLKKSEENNKLVKATIIDRRVFDKTPDNKNKEAIAKKINEKLLLKELSEQREKEINKRKYSNYNKKIDNNKDIDNTKYFFDEGIVDKLSTNKTEKTKNLKEINEKKKLEKKVANYKNNNNEREVNLITAFNAQPVIQLQEKKLIEKTEIFTFNSNQVDLDISQKMKISEYVNQIINKPIKIEIRSFFTDDRNLSQTRTLRIRAYLVKLGVSHNRIKITQNKDASSNSNNNITISFIEI